LTPGLHHVLFFLSLDLKLRVHRDGAMAGSSSNWSYGSVVEIPVLTKCSM
jgi:hypothetical protein